MKTNLFLVLASLILMFTCITALSSCLPTPPDDIIEDECLHENKWELVDEVIPTCTEDGSIEHYVCSDCGVMLDKNLQIIESIVIEKLGHKPGDATVEAEPTCTEDGKSVTACTVCNEILSSKKIPALGHNLTESLAIGPDNNICVNGALVIKTCTECDYKGYDILPANADEGADSHHKVEKWTLLVAPTYTEPGVMEGKCTNKHCQEIVTYELPCISSEYYAMIDAIPDTPCSSDFTVSFRFIGESYFTYEITEGKETKTVENLTFSVTIEAYNHVLNGIEMDAESYDRNTEGIVYCPTCPECTLQGTQGCYVCDVCGEIIYVLINDKHTVSDKSWITTIAPGCESEGEKQAVCEIEGCETIITETIPALGHDFSYILEFAEDGKSYVLTGVCKAEGCEAVAVYENVTGVSVDEFKATCKSNGFTVHKFTFANSNINYSTSDVSVEFSTEVAQLEHTVDGIKLTENGTYNVVDYLFLEKYASVYVTCSADVPAIVSCSICERDDIVIMFHKDHTSLSNPIAGCEDYVAELSCKFCQATYCVDVSGTGHDIDNYTTIKEAEEDGLYYIGGFCSKCCAEGETVYEADPVVITVTEVAATCQSAGSINYFFDGKVIMSYETEPACHALDGIDMINSPEIFYSIKDYPGIKPFGDAVIDSCITPTEAYFNCDICKEVVRIMAVADHTVTEWTTSIPSTCDTKGTQVGSCSICGEEVKRSIPALGHTYEYDFTLSTKTLVGYCITEGCEHSYSLTKTKRVIVESTCVKNGSVTYTGLNADGAEETVELELALVPHGINGITVNEYGAYEITPNKVGALANTDAICGNTVEGYYVCDGCGQHIQTTVYQPHVIASEDKAVILNPTCTESGTKTLKCLLCNETLAVEGISALGHSYAVSVVSIPTKDICGEAIGVCECGYTTSYKLPVINEDNYDTPKAVKETTCLEEGIYIYTYTITDGENSYDVEFEIITSKFVYDDSCETTTIDIKEDVTFTDPFGNVITEKVTVSYVCFECPGVNCEITILHSKSFVYDENLFVYDFELGEYVISLPEGEK